MLSGFSAKRETSTALQNTLLLIIDWFLWRRPLTIQFLWRWGSFHGTAKVPRLRLRLEQLVILREPFSNLFLEEAGSEIPQLEFFSHATWVLQPEGKARFNFGMDKQTSNSVNFTHVEQRSQLLISNKKTLCRKACRNKRKSQVGRCNICRKRFRSQGKLEIHLALHAAGSTKITTKRCFLCRFCDTKHHGLRAFLDHQSLNMKCRPVIHQRAKKNTQEGTNRSQRNRRDPGLSISIIINNISLTD